MLTTEVEIQELNARFSKKEPQEILEWALNHYKDEITLACSLSAEDTLLLDMVMAIRKDTRVFILDTGRLHEETYEILDRCRLLYGKSIDIIFPQAQEVQQLVTKKGPYSFYTSIENRKECCAIRKVEPLERALRGMKAWITGLRKEQSVARQDVQKIEIDSNHNGILKLSPLMDWSWQQVLDFAQKNKIPLHPLHAKGYPSIGCQPCTRAIQQGEDFRAGRWWWEVAQNKECGLHTEKFN